MTHGLEQRAVVDRVEGDVAVLLVGDAEREFPIAVTDLPSGIDEGGWLVVRVDGDVLTVFGPDPGGEAARRDHVSDGWSSCVIAGGASVAELGLRSLHCSAIDYRSSGGTSDFISPSRRVAPAS